MPEIKFPGSYRLVIPLAFGLLAAVGYAQSPATAHEFDAVSIKPSIQTRNGPVQFGPGRAFSDSVSTYRIILAAYHLKDYQVIGVTGWIDSDWFALEAKASAPTDESQLRLMLQTLLSKRFKLVAHRETREMPVYSLVVGKNGMKLREWKPGDPLPPRGGTPGISAGALSHKTLESFVGELNLPGINAMYGLNRPVLDKTGLSGVYLFNYWYDSPDDFRIGVIEDQLGLKLEPQKAPVDVLVIDHVEKPPAN
jgi:uncharacterized protein (TIGR03435 family)